MRPHLNWAEDVAMLCLVIGFALSLLATNVFAIYSISFLSGLVFGRRWYKQRGDLHTPLYLQIIFFFFGYLIAAIYTDIRILSLCLFGGIFISYWLHKKNIIRSLEY